jgi:hypothetical protein
LYCTGAVQYIKSAMPYILSKAVGGLGVPPLPLVTDAAACLAFLLDSLDDAVEDAAKFLLLYLLGYVAYRAAMWWHGSSAHRMARAFAVVVLLCCHPPCDRLADQLGDQMHPVQNALRRGFGYREKMPRPDRGDAVAKFGLAASLVDDFVEDSFKAVCISSHMFIGNILRTAVLARAAEADMASAVRGGNLLAKTAGAVIAVGAPVSQYQNCNIYSDRLADKVQKWLSLRSEHRSVFSSSAGSSGKNDDDDDGDRKQWKKRKKKKNIHHQRRRKEEQNI